MKFLSVLRYDNVMKSPALTIAGLSKCYGTHQALDALDLTVQRGEVVGFLGPNGAGKTTTIRAILNFIAPTAGSVSVLGLDSIRDSVAVKRKVGYLAGDIALYGTQTGRQLLEFLTDLGNPTDWVLVEDLAKRLQEDLTRPIHTLSKGNIQKIGLIQAFMAKPDVIILDEPTSGLDPLMQQVFYEMVREVKADGRTVFLSSHNLTEVQKICDKVAFIREGKLVSFKEIGAIGDMTIHKLDVMFGESVSAKAFAEVAEVEQIGDKQLLLTVHGDLAPVLGALSKHHIIGLQPLETTLEDVFMRYYHQETT